MLLLRFFVADPPLPSQGRARSRGRTRVSASSPTLLPQPSTSSFVHFGCPYNHPVGIPTTPRGSPQALFRFTLPFKSHSAPRPPQTPAASSLSPYRKRLGSRSRFAPKVCPQPFPIKASDDLSIMIETLFQCWPLTSIGLLQKRGTEKCDQSFVLCVTPCCWRDCCNAFPALLTRIPSADQ